MYDTSFLGQNIKKYRRLSGLTQSELASKLYLTSQNVSKWETGKSAPDVNNLCALARVLGVSTDLLLSSTRQSEDERIFIAIDGGGTKTEFCLFSETGEIIDRLIIEGSNPNVYGIDGACETLRRGIAKLLSSRVCSVYAGIAGCGLESNKRAILSYLKKQFPTLTVIVDGDIPNILYSTDYYDCCIAVIMGTGSIVCSKVGEEISMIGGWGYLFDSTFSGYELGRQAIVAALREEDGIGDETLITKLLYEKLGSTIHEKIGLLYSSKNELIASFARLVLKAYDAGDAVAQQIISKALENTAEQIRAAIKKNAEVRNVVLSGGLTTRADIIKRYITNIDGVKIVFPELPPIYGAVRRSNRLMEVSNKEFDAKFIKDYKRG